MSYQLSELQRASYKSLISLHCHLLYYTPPPTPLPPCHLHALVVLGRYIVEVYWENINVLHVARVP